MIVQDILYHILMIYVHKIVLNMYKFMIKTNINAKNIAFIISIKL